VLLRICYSLLLALILNYSPLFGLKASAQILYSETFDGPNTWQMDIDGNVLILNSLPLNGAFANTWAINSSGPDNIDGTTNLHISCLGGNCDVAGTPINPSGTKFDATLPTNNTNKVARMSSNFPNSAFVGTNMVLEFDWICNNSSLNSSPGMIMVYSTDDGLTWTDRSTVIYNKTNSVQIESIAINSANFNGFNGAIPKLRIGYRWFNEQFAAPALPIDNGIVIDNLRIRNILTSGININPATPTAACQGSTIAIDYGIGGFPPSTTFVLEISNAIGSFASPNNLGTLGISPSNISIPTNTIPGAGYKIRIKASDNTVSNAVNFNIKKNPNPFITGIFSICSGAATSLTAFPANNITSYSWFLNNVPITGSTNIITVSTAGSYTIQVDSLGCSTTSIPASVTNQISPNASINGSSNIIVCMDGINPIPNILRSNSGLGLSYQWFKDGNPIFPNGTNDTLVIISAGSYFVEVNTIANSCKTASNPVSAIEKQVPPAPNAGLDSAVCSQYIVSAGFLPGAAFNGLSYNWFPTTGVLDFFTLNPSPNSPYTKITLVNNGATPEVKSYRLYAIDPVTGCTNSDEVKITVNPNPQNVTGGEDRILCEGTAPISLSGLPVNTSSSANPVGTGAWLGSGITTVSNQPVFTPASALVGQNTLTYIYYLDWKNGGKRCQNFKYKIITVNSSPQVVAGDPMSFCNGIDSVLLTGFTPAYPAGKWSGPSISEKGMFFPAALPIGNYVCTLSATNAQGCAGLGTRIITISASPLVDAGPISQTLCSNQGAYQMTGFSPPAGSNGKWSSPTVTISSGGALNFNVSNSGIHVLTYTFIKDGCKTVDSVFMTIITAPKVLVGNNDSICSSSSPIILRGVTPIGGRWRGQGVDASGTIFTPSPASVGPKALTYKISLNGCPDSAVRIMFVKSSPIVDAGLNDTICAGLDSLKMNGFIPANGKWSGTGIDSNGVFRPKKFNLVGNITVRYTVKSTNGCQSEDEKQITVFPLPQAIAGLDTATCTGFQLKIGNSKISNLKYKWFEPLPNTISDDTIAEPILTIINNKLIPEVFLVRLLVTDTISKCSNRDTSKITVYPRPVAVSIFPGIKTKCAGDTFTIRARTRAGLLYEWIRNGLSMNVASEKDSVLKTSFSGRYKLVVRNRGAFCTDTSSSDSLSIFERFIPKIGGVLRFCKDSSTQLTVQPQREGFTFEWQFNGKNVPDSLGTTFTIGKKGTVRVILRTEKGCRDTSAITPIDSLPFPSIGILNDTTICEGSLAIFKVPKDSLYNYRWTDSTTNAIVSINDSLITSKKGKYYVEVYNFCSVATDSVSLIKVNPLPRFGIFNSGRQDTLVCKFIPISLFGPSGFEEYLWTIYANKKIAGNRLQLSTDTVGNVPVALKVTDQFGCTNTDTGTVKIRECSPVVYVPTAFSPQGDNINEKWILQVYNVIELKVYVYNRWGEMVFYSNDLDRIQNTGWDGSFNGTKCPSGAYKWIVEYKGMLDDLELVNKNAGTVTIIR